MKIEHSCNDEHPSKNNKEESAEVAVNSDGTRSSENGEHGLNSSCKNGESAARGEDVIVHAPVPAETSVAPVATVSAPGAHAIVGPNLNNDGEQEHAPELDAVDEAGHDAVLSTPPGAYSMILVPDDFNAEEMVLDAQVESVLEGFVPRRRTSLQERINDLRQQTMITLDDSAVHPVHNASTSGNVTRNDETESGGSNNDSSRKCSGSKNHALSAVLVLALLCLVTVLAVVFGSERSGNSSSSSSSEGNGSTFYYSCDEIELATNDESTNNRYVFARQIISKITPVETLDDLDSPQGKALHWIVCVDGISSKLLNERDLSTGQLPKQTHGSFHGGNSGESQVIRRYALATFYFSTSEDGPWDDSWNFLTPNIHECGWHKNYTRENWPYGDFDPAGILCNAAENSGFTASPIILNDTLMEVGPMTLNFRIPNNLTGTLPPELGHLVDVALIAFEQQVGLRGSIPYSIGSMINLGSIAILFSGPDFGGEIPDSLFTIPSLEYVSLKFNTGVWSFPDSLESDEILAPLLQLGMKSCGMSGTIPSFISKFKNITIIDLEGNSLQGSIPSSFGNLALLEYLSIYDNQLTGTLPKTLGNLSNVTAIVLGKNELNGSIPSSMGNLGKMRLIDLSYNKLEGSIPSSFSGLVGLEHISLQENNLSGSISVFENLEHVSSLILASNQFNGSIPSGLFPNPTVNIYADFARNNFVGELPQSFSQIATKTNISNEITDDTVDDVICEEVSSLIADCSSCSCCKTCCDNDAKGSITCTFDLNFYILAGLECSSWWHACISGGSSYDPLPED